MSIDFDPSQRPSAANLSGINERPLLPEMGEASFQPALTILQPNPGEEWARIKNYFENFWFYTTNDYLDKLPLPQEDPFPFFISRIVGKDHQRPSDEEFAELEEVFYDNVYDDSSYGHGIGLLQQAIPILREHIFPVMSEHQTTLGFYIPPHGYKVTLSEFGTTGSYRTKGLADEKESEVTVLFTGTENAQQLLERLTHEIAHIGFGQRLIQPGAFRHDNKESTIDDYVTAHFGYLFPEYESQGDWRFDKAKFKKLLDVVVYVAMLEGVELPDKPDASTGRVRALLQEYSTSCHRGQDGRGKRRSDGPRIHQVYPEHQWPPAHPYLG
jgi:hypothetical protein